MSNAQERSARPARAHDLRGVEPDAVRRARRAPHRPTFAAPGGAGRGAVCRSVGSGTGGRHV
ncbi:hypothetical protein ACFS5L_30870 [Streptomyces phyllanthi]|uniref:Uncharacterized protein n=1 Tax=Streptomyces phyllanthi TaxID=1803180 RepID=A0A5N8W0X2_9ACTN|nr:hypothetical protein [Streptomyces phyllanthi]MPY41160.1 hypothetical protein [Streptomyces phyllanthi]